MAEDPLEIKEISQLDFKSLTQQVWNMAMTQPQAERLREIGEDKVLEFINKNRILQRMYELELAANKPLLNRINKNDIFNMDAIWCLSAPGTFFDAKKNDRYQEVPYIRWWDRQQISTAIGLAGIIGRLRLGLGVVGKLDETKKFSAFEKSPTVIYNGRPDENEALRKAVAENKLPQGFPGNKLHIIDTDMGKNFNSSGQVRNFIVPEGVVLNRLGIIIRPAQAIRLLHFMNNQDNGFPKGVSVKIFPVRTSEGGIPSHYIQETCGILYYRFTTSDAAEKPYHYEF